MAPSEDVKFNFLTSECRYKNEKILEAFNLFIKLSTAIVGGIFFLHWKLPINDPQRATIGCAANLLFLLVASSMAFLIFNNLRSWWSYRKQISQLDPNVPAPKGVFWFLSELVMYVLIVLACYFFWDLNPLTHKLSPQITG